MVERSWRTKWWKGAGEQEHGGDQNKNKRGDQEKNKRGDHVLALNKKRGDCSWRLFYCAKLAPFFTVQSWCKCLTLFSCTIAVDFVLLVLNS
jgi:hypothetical protein